MPVNDWTAGVLDHLLPVLDLGPLAVVTKDDTTDGVRGANPVVIGHSQLKVDSL